LPSFRRTLFHISFVFVDIERAVFPVIEVAALARIARFEMNCPTIEPWPIVGEIHIRRRIGYDVADSNPVANNSIRASHDRVALHGLAASGMPRQHNRL